LRISIPRWTLIVLLLLTVASPHVVFAAKQMRIQASVNPTQSDLGIQVLISGRVSEPDNLSISNAVVSIQVNNPEGTSIHVAIAYTNTVGAFQDSFPLESNSPAGNYTAFLVADKPGYDTSKVTLAFTILSPDFSIGSLVAGLTVQQGQNRSFTVTILSLRRFSQPVDLTAIDPPPGVTLVFSPSSVIPSGSTTANVLVSSSAQVGNYSVAILAVSGAVSHRMSFQLNVTSGPVSRWPVLPISAGLVLVLLGALGLVLRSRRQRRKREAVLEELLRQASADSGYVATARVLARLEELRGMDKVDEGTYQRLKKEYEKRLERSR
jgi:hypothetical protein